MEIFFVLVGLALFCFFMAVKTFKKKMYESRKALEDPEVFQEYCEKNGYDTHAKQIEFCERMKVSSSVIDQLQATKNPISTNDEILTPRREKALYKLATQILEDDAVDHRGIKET